MAQNMTMQRNPFSHKLEANLNNDLYKLKEYLDYNRLSLNIPKCEFMLIGTHQANNMPQLNMHITNEPLGQVLVAKYLGMNTDSYLKLDENIGKLIQTFRGRYAF